MVLCSTKSHCIAPGPECDLRQCLTPQSAFQYPSLPPVRALVCRRLREAIARFSAAASSPCPASSRRAYLPRPRGLSTAGETRPRDQCCECLWLQQTSTCCHYRMATYSSHRVTPAFHQAVLQWGPGGCRMHMRAAVALACSASAERCTTSSPATRRVEVRRCLPSFFIM